MPLSAPGSITVILCWSVFLRPDYLPFRLFSTRLIARLSPLLPYIFLHQGTSPVLPISTRIEYQVLHIVFKAQMGVAPNYLCDAIRIPTSASSLCPLYAPLTGGSFLSLGLGQLRLNLYPFRLLALPFGIALHHQLVLLSYHQIFLLPGHFLKRVSFLFC